MSKPLLFNVVWLVLAVAAFVVGRASVDSSSAADDSAAVASKSDSRNRPSSLGSLRGDNSSRPGIRPLDSSFDRDRGSGSSVTVAQFLNESDPLVANKMFADLLLGLTAENAPELFEALQENRAEGQQVGLFLEAWGKIDGPAAIAAIADMEGDGRRRAFGTMAALTGWASVDPESAKAHIDSAENGWEKSMMMQGLVSGLARTDPAAATAYVLQVDAEQRAAGGDEREDRFRGFSVDRQMDAIAQVQMKRGVDEATAWAEGLPDGSIKASAFDRVAEELARTDAVAAGEWVKAHAGSEYAERAVREVAEHLAREDPASAVAWAEDLPENSKAAAMRESIERWTREDPVAAGEYLTNMPSSEVRDSAVSSFARSLDREDPQIAAEWAASIGNEELRGETLQSVARSWIRTNPDEAKQWLPNSGIPAEAQQDILRDAERGGGRGDRRDWRR